MVTLEGVQTALSRISEIESRIAGLSGGAVDSSSGPAFASVYQTNTPVVGTESLGAGGKAPSGVDVDQFATDLLGAIGAPVSQENLRALRAWVQAEGTSARFNPLATTQQAPGATAFNSVGVRNFTSYEQGLATTVQVLNNGKYGDILAAFRSGTNAQAVAGAIAQSPWGTGELVGRILGPGARPTW